MKRLAPNGRVSNLTTEQWKLVRTPAFKKWFGDWENDPKNSSKVVDENGEPLVVYHNPSYGDCNENIKYPFTVFDIEQKFQNTKIDTPSGKAFYFALDLNTASFFSNCSQDVFLKKVYRCFLNVRNTSNTSISAFSFDDLERINLSIKNTKNCDGTYLHNYDLASAIEDGWNGIGDADQIIVFNSNQIKLATGENTTFDSNNPDIRFGSGGELDRTLEEQAKNFRSVNAFIKSQGKPVYHGSRASAIIEKEGFKLLPPEKRNMASAFGEGIYLATKKSGAYTSSSEGMVEAYLPKDIKLKKIFDSDAYRVNTKKLIEEGYDGVELQTGVGNKNLTIFDPSIIKTKTQLTDIWNKAHKVTEGSNPDIRYADGGEIKLLSETIRDRKEDTYSIGKSYADVTKYDTHWGISYIESDKKGDGAKLMDKIIDDAKKENVSEITLQTGNGSEYFFKKFGFIITEDDSGYMYMKWSNPDISFGGGGSVGEYYRVRAYRDGLHSSIGRWIGGEYKSISKAIDKANEEMSRQKKSLEYGESVDILLYNNGKEVGTIWSYNNSQSGADKGEFVFMKEYENYFPKATKVYENGGEVGKAGEIKYECIISVKAINKESAENRCLKYIPTYCHTPIKLGKGRIYTLETTMFFNSEEELFNYFKELKNKGIELYHYEEVNKKEDSNEMEKGGLTASNGKKSNLTLEQYKLQYTLSNPYKNVFLLEMTSQHDLASVFAKCQAFYEWDEFKGKKFSIHEFHDWYKVNHPELKPYEEEFYGFNLPSDVIDECYKINDERTEYDNFFLNIISEIKQKHDNFYIIGAVTGDKKTIDHELAHSFFWRFRLYKNKMKKLVDDLPNRDKLFSILSEERGYGENVLYDEAQAFLATGLIINISEWEEYREPFIKMFNRQKYISTTKAIERASKKYRQKRYGTTEQRKEHYEKYQKDWKKENKEHLTEYQRKHRKDYPSYKKRLEKLRSPEFKQKFREKYFMDKHGSLDKMKELDERKNKRKKDKIEKEHEVSKRTHGEGDVYIHPFLGDVRMYEYGEKYSLVFVPNHEGTHPIIKRVQTRVLVKK